MEWSGQELGSSSPEDMIECRFISLFASTSFLKHRLGMLLMMFEIEGCCKFLVHKQ